MSALSLDSSITRARDRLAGRARASRADAGRSRLPREVEEKIRELLTVPERPRMRDVAAALSSFCRRKKLPVPSRSTLYNAIDRVAPPTFATDELPACVRRTLHNVAHGSVPGHQVVFAAFNYGDTSAISFAAGLPWICLHRAAQLGGWRPKSLALLRAVIAYRER